MNLDRASFPAFCRHEDALSLAEYQDEQFAEWRDGLSVQQLGDYALQWVESLTHVHGKVQGEIKTRAPYLGHYARVEFNGPDVFDNYLRSRWACLPDGAK
jgi:hypothetical protein